MYCPHCKRPIPEFINHCPNCGCMISNYASVPVVPPSRQIPPKKPNIFGGVNLVLSILLAANFVFVLKIYANLALVKMLENEGISTSRDSSSSFSVPDFSLIDYSDYVTTTKIDLPQLDRKVEHKDFLSSLSPPMPLVFDVQQGMSPDEVAEIMGTFFFSEDDKVPLIETFPDKPDVSIYTYYFYNFWYQIGDHKIYIEKPVGVCFRFIDDQLDQWLFGIGMAERNKVGWIDADLPSDEVNEIVDDLCDQFSVALDVEPYFYEDDDDDGAHYIFYKFPNGDDCSFIVMSIIYKDTDSGYAAVFIDQE